MDFCQQLYIMAAKSKGTVLPSKCTVYIQKGVKMLFFNIFLMFCAELSFPPGVSIGILKFNTGITISVPLI